MAKPKSQPQPSKAGKHKKGGVKPAQVVEAQPPAAETEQPQAPLAAEAPPQSAIPPAPDAPGPPSATAGRDGRQGVRPASIPWPLGWVP